jgi:hypothetical protein
LAQLYEQFTSGADADSFYLPKCSLEIYLVSGAAQISPENYQVTLDFSAVYPEPDLCFQALYNAIVESELDDTTGLPALLESLRTLLRPYKQRGIDIPLRSESLFFLIFWSPLYLCY